jgi:hypothetical protein
VEHCTSCGQIRLKDGARKYEGAVTYSDNGTDNGTKEGNSQ